MNEQSKLTTQIISQQRFSETIESRFWKKVIIQYGCWKWIGAKHALGYGAIGRGATGSGNISAQRLSYLIHKGDIPLGMEILHQCDNPECCNPDHLNVGTHKQNMVEARERNRIKNTGKKLTEEMVCEIRALEGRFKQKEIGKMFSVTDAAVRRVFDGTHWKKKFIPHEMKRISYKLRENDIPQIRDMLKTMTQPAVAKRFNVSRTCIQAVANGRTWRHVV